MKKELFIVILAVIAIIAISALLKYVIFKNYAQSGAAAANTCDEICKSENFAWGRCGFNNDCSEQEKAVAPTGKNIKKVESFCNSISKVRPENFSGWTCCCGKK